MLDLRAALFALVVIASIALGGWVVSLFRRDVSLVDSLWPLFFFLGALTYFGFEPMAAQRPALVLILVAVWAVRLSVHLTVRNFGKAEDRRYQAIRARNEPGFEWKSVYLVFGLQAGLAWIIALPLFAAMSGSAPYNALDTLALMLWTAGFACEAVADWQLARFKSNPAQRGRVLDTGLWRYSRHPNYFGEALLWWGFYAFAAAAGAWWTLFAPVLMTVLLLKVSGVPLLEQDIAERRPGYRDYIHRTSAFIPRPPKDLA
jgi:steroid 5-alpha reductase family enzyme